MRFLTLASVALLGCGAVQALAQVPPDAGGTSPRSTVAGNIVPADTKSEIAAALPTTDLGPTAGAKDYLRAARAALMANRTGQAQQSLEMAETRALDRSVPQGFGNAPSPSVFVARIRDALHALGDGNRAQAISLIDGALAA